MPHSSPHTSTFNCTPWHVHSSLDSSLCVCGRLNEKFIENEFESSTSIWKCFRGRYSEIAKIYDENTPDGLQRKFYQVAAFELAWRGEVAGCLVEHFKEETQNDGTLSNRLQYNPIFGKTTQGGAHKLAEDKWLVPNHIDEDLCPVRLFRKLMSKRTDRITTSRLC